MHRTFFIATALLLLPASALAARAPSTFEAANSLLMASSSPGNAYVAGASVVVTATVAGDLSAAGGSVVAAAPVTGDSLLFGGSVSSRARVGGDLRTAGGTITVEEPVAGDIVAFGYAVHDLNRAGGSVFIAAVDADLEDGAAGPVTVYGNNVVLAGTYGGDVTVVASNHLTLAASTTIVGKLVYQAPEQATIPASATIMGGIQFENASYLPPAGTSRVLAAVSLGFFLFARILGALIIAGLVAGLFPRLSEVVTDRAYSARVRSVLLALLLGFGILVATPVLLVLLSLTFVGIGLAIILFLLYALLVLLSLAYAGILLGSVGARRFMGREAVYWYDGVFGMLALSLVSLIPILGPLVIGLLMIFTAGVLLQLFFSFAFPHEDRTAQML